jgi:hypothetical protein
MLKAPTQKTSKYAIARLKKPQRTFTVEEDRPLPGGEAKGL